MKNSIIIKQTKENIIIKINEDLEVEEVLEQLTSKLEQLKILYKEEKTPIVVTGKDFTRAQMEKLEKVIKEKIDVEVKFDVNNELGLSGIKETFEKDITVSQTKYYKGALRSGQKLEYEGSLVIIGDVNGGAEVIAGENIAIIGSLRGLAHAGAKGNKKAIITALEIKAPQLRIANIVKEIEINEEQIVKRQFASIQNGQIVIE